MATTSDSLTALSKYISAGLDSEKGKARELLEALFGDRYRKFKRNLEPTLFRDAYALANEEGKDAVPYAGIINPDNPGSGAYGGACVVWFPSAENGSLIALGIGTRGLPPDEGLLTRPGHRRRVAALRMLLSNEGFCIWSKPDPAALGAPIPKVVTDQHAGFEALFKKYSNELYCIARVPKEPQKARRVVQAFFDLYAYERGWQPLKVAEAEFNALLQALRAEFFRGVTSKEVYDVLEKRRFAVLQGPPGTGKTRLAEKIREEFFGGNGMTVQFHPAVTYEDFVIGLTPDAETQTLRFNVKAGWLMQAADEAREKPYLLVLDEINRADLGKILGEAIYLFESGEADRRVQLPHRRGQEIHFSLPKNLFVLGTMNTADRSIAALDLAIRRRFAFVTLPPERKVVEDQKVDLAIQVFDRLTDVFVEHAPADGMDLLPGHSYFIAKNESELKRRFRYELIPLLDEYLREGFLGQAATELHAVRDEIEGLAR